MPVQVEQNEKSIFVLVTLALMAGLLWLKWPFAREPLG